VFSVFHCCYIVRRRKRVYLVSGFWGSFVLALELAKMSLNAAEDESTSEIHIPAEIDWDMLDKSKFFFLGAALFSGVSTALYPMGSSGSVA